MFSNYSWNVVGCVGELVLIMAVKLIRIVIGRVRFVVTVVIIVE
jgi:hypothetical protein